jgi:hypothetical protein
MQVALGHNGDEITAGPDAPAQAICPDCGSPVDLRSRSTMDGGLTWYWRHPASAPQDCPRRYQVDRQRTSRRPG